MITATVRYRLPRHHRQGSLLPALPRHRAGFAEAKGLQQALHLEQSGWAGVYQSAIARGRAGVLFRPWRAASSRYGMEPLIDYYEALARMDNERGSVETY
jgi:hypothetical protein